MLLNKDSILAASDFVYVDHEVPEWEGTVRLRGLSAAERDEFEATLGVSQDLTNMRARLVVSCMVDDSGQRIFKNSEAKALGEKNATVINRLFEEVRKLSGMADEDLGIAEGN